MNRKRKVVFTGSLALNVLLLLFLVIGYQKMNLVHKELFNSEVQTKLVELDGLIEVQKNNNWPEPNLVTTQLGDVLNGIQVSMNSGKYSGWLSKDDRMTMERLDLALRQYPHDELYKFSMLSQSDKDNFVVLQSNLEKAGFGMNMTMSNNWTAFMYKSGKLLAFLQK